MEDIKLVSWEESERKWELAVDSDGIPITGYYGGYKPFQHRGGQDNVSKTVGKYPIIEGDLKLFGVEKGRSSVIFAFNDSEGRKWHMTTSGVERLLKSLCYKSVIGFNMTQISEEDEFIFSGKWTIIKQGTQVSIIPLD